MNKSIFFKYKIFNTGFFSERLDIALFVHNKAIQRLNSILYIYFSEINDFFREIIFEK